ncbi:flagellar hook protein [Paracoccus sp. MBLB3053]|uniref:Flagellar hook protein n=1 Tax=Paracoccus aurantius TaxID=3073814 RepID=A0ABU2HQ57_9RHOB|nr:flagellar hook protein [Paracoccus sp. MBLB3053]MDS9466892.1 flagellar hook protein [Paracoccus sp. MBLB3053]
MTNFNSVGDLARSHQLRLSQSAMKSKLAELSGEVTSGIKSDIPAALGGDMVRISQVESRLGMLSVLGQNLAQAETFLSGLQTSLTSMHTLVSGTIPTLLSDSLLSSDTALQVQLKKGPEDLRSVLQMLNQSVAGRHIFSGSGSTGLAVVQYDTLMAQVGTAVSGLTDPDQIVAGIDAYFDAAPGSGGFADLGYLGGAAASDIPIGPGQKVSVGITANSAELSEMLKGLAILAYAAENPQLGTSVARKLTKDAASRLATGELDLISAQGSIGMQEERLARVRVANQAEVSALTIARNGMISADPFESASALEELATNVEALYALTARLSKLNLTDYL